MNFFTNQIKKVLRRTNLPVGHCEKKNNTDLTLDDDQANKYLMDFINSNAPLFVGRYGWTEINATIAYVSGISKNVRFGLTIKFLLKIFLNNPKLLKYYSGFFSNDKKNMKLFCKHQVDIAPNIDILSSWMKQEKFMFKYMKNNVEIISTSVIFNPYSNNPWTQALKGKKVLIVNPFISSIKKQYERRDLLFENPNFLPKFELLTLRSVQTFNDSKCEFDNWWNALDHMKNEISKIDFDIALLGCGAYGLPLCNFIKGLGKQAIYAGGVTQLFFGIYGSRWENSPFINKYWIRPLPEDTKCKTNKTDSYW